MIEKIHFSEPKGVRNKIAPQSGVLPGKPSVVKDGVCFSGDTHKISEKISADVSSNSDKIESLQNVVPAGIEQVKETERSVTVSGAIHLAEADSDIEVGSLDTDQLFWWCRGVDVKPHEKNWESRLGRDARVQNTWDIDSLKGTVPSLEQVNSLFQKVASDKSIPWGYLKDGCFARAHVVCDELLKQGYNCGKIYAIVAKSDKQGDPLGRFVAGNQYMKGKWWYHVGALVFAYDKNNSIEGYVIDPSVSDKPITPDKWIESFWNKNFPIRFDVTPADIMNPQNQCETEKEPCEFCKAEFEHFIPIARAANRKNSQALETLKKYECNNGEEYA
ncbi:MAG: protein-glutamine glutaminase family protein [Vulcanimicrobiota bacterium]